MCGDVSECVRVFTWVSPRSFHEGEPFQIHTDKESGVFLKFTENSWNCFLPLCGCFPFHSYQCLRGSVEVTRVPVFRGEMVIKYIVIRSTLNLPNWDDSVSLSSILANSTHLNICYPYWCAFLSAGLL